jgi:hypothetical protein
MSISRAFSAANDTEASHPHAFAIQDEFYLISRVMRAFRVRKSGEDDDDDDHSDASFRINKSGGARPLVVVCARRVGKCHGRVNMLNNRTM